MADADRRGQALLELVGEAALGEPEVEGGVEQLLELGDADDLARHRHRRLAGHELTLGERLGVVFGCEREDPFAQVAGRVGHRSASRRGVPLDGPRHALGQRDRRLPAQHRARPARVEELVVDLARPRG